MPKLAFLLVIGNGPVILAHRTFQLHEGEDLEEQARSRLHEDFDNKVYSRDDVDTVLYGFQATGV